MNINVFRRIVESFFRRWPLYVALFVGVVAFGASSLLRAEATYTSSGTIFVDNQSLVTAQSGIQSGGSFGYLSPAQFTSQELNGLLQTDSFMEAVLNSAGVTLESDPSERQEQVTRLRDGIGSYAPSANLVKVNVTSPDPDLSYELTDATIAEFVQFQIGLDIAESGASEEFFSDLAQAYEEDLEQARQAVDAALLGVDDDTALTLAQELQIQRLQDAEALAESRYQSAANDIEVSRLAMLQTETDIRQSYSTFDPPQRPTKGDGDFLPSVPVLLLVVGAGAALALAWPIALGFTDRTVLFGEDLTADTAVLGVIPRSSKRSTRLKYISRSNLGEEVDVEPELGSIYERAAKTRTFVPTASSQHSSEGMRTDNVSATDDSSESIMLGGLFDDSNLDQPDSDDQESSAEDFDGRDLDDFAEHQTQADEEQTEPTETEPTDREDEPDEAEPKPRHTSTLMSWASPADDNLESKDHKREGLFVVVETYEPSPDFDDDRSGADHDGSIDGGGQDLSPGFDPSVTTELQIPPDIPAVQTRDGQKVDQHQSDSEQHVAARTHHA